MPNPQNPHNDTKGTRKKKTTAAVLDSLQYRFAEFRQAQPQAMRFPETLRRAAVAALKQGASPGDLRRACGITADQLRQWQKGTKSASSPKPEEYLEAQCLSVVEPPAIAANANDTALEVRLGPWTVTIRQAN